MKQYFKLYPSCILVNGKHSSCIYDLLRKKLHPIDNDIYNVLHQLQLNGGIVKSLEQQFENNFNAIKNLFSALENSNIGYFTNTLDLQNLNSSYESPYDLYSLTIELSLNQNKFEKIFDEIYALNINSIHLSFQKEVSVSFIQLVLKKFINSHIRSIELSLFASNTESLNQILEEIDLKRVSLVYCFTNNTIENRKYNNTFLNFNYSQLNDLYHPVNSTDQLLINYKAFTEANHFNLGLNSHIYINSDGDVYNHIGHSNKVGNCIETPIKTIINNNELKTQWSFNNDKIEKCKLCQYRYCCFDTSEIIEKNGLYFKKNSCNLNPSL